MINIMLVEDNAVNQFVAVKLLQRWGMSVVVAGDGQEALELIKGKSFQLVLMDLEMPVMDGFESARKIREMGDMYFKTIPIIAFSASEIEDERAKATESGMTDLVSKPLNQEELQNAIDKYVFGSMKNEDVVRPLHIDFDQYTDGDAEFKQELIALMVTDMADMQKSITGATRLDNMEMFMKACHKSKATVTMLDDEELTLILDELKVQMKESKDIRNGFEETVLRFIKLSEEVQQSLSLLNHQDEKNKNLAVE